MKHIYISSCDKAGGIFHYTLENGRLTLRESTPVDKPMYTVYRNGRMYVILKKREEADGFGAYMSFAVTASGTLTDPTEPVSTLGHEPCHLEVTDDDVFIVNYTSGSIISAKGRMDVHSGCGPNPERQEMAHTHFIALSPDKKYLLSCDLGLDTVFTYDFALNVVSTAKVPAGEGPRHLAWSGDGQYVYCVNELGCSVSVFAYDDGALTLLGTYPAMPEGTNGSTAAAIRFRDGFVYITIRGEDTLVRFKAVGDGLVLDGRWSVGGSFPRDFNFAEDCVIFTNEHSENVTVFRMDGDRSELTDEEAGIPDPLCVTVLGEEEL